MVLWRICNHADLRGIGGLRGAARWHYAGQPVVYLAEHPAASHFLLNPTKRDAAQVEIMEVISIRHDPRIMELLHPSQHAGPSAPV